MYLLDLDEKVFGSFLFLSSVSLPWRRNQLLNLCQVLLQVYQIPYHEPFPTQISINTLFFASWVTIMMLKPETSASHRRTRWEKFPLHRLVNRQVWQRSPKKKFLSMLLTMLMVSILTKDLMELMKKLNSKIKLTMNVTTITAKSSLKQIVSKRMVRRRDKYRGECRGNLFGHRTSCRHHWYGTTWHLKWTKRHGQWKVRW